MLMLLLSIMTFDHICAQFPLPLFARIDSMMLLLQSILALYSLMNNALCDVGILKSRFYGEGSEGYCSMMLVVCASDQPGRIQII